MSDSTKMNEKQSVAADALNGNLLQESANYISNEKVDITKKVGSKTQKPLKLKSINDVDDKTNSVSIAAENDKSVATSTGDNPNNSNNTSAATTTPLNSSNYFGNRSNPNINGAKKSFEKRYNSISFSPNVNLHSSILNSSPILKPKKTLHVTNFTMNKCDLRNLLLSFSGFKTVAFYQDYCFVVFADIESATAAAEQLLAKTKLKVNFSKADYIPNVVSPSSIGNPNSILHVTNYPTSTTEQEMVEMYSSYPGYVHIHFSKNFSLVYYQDIPSAKNALQHMNQTTNFTTIYSIKNANSSPINMNNNYHNNVPNGPPPYNPLMNNGYRNMGVNGGLMMPNAYPPPPPPVAPNTPNFNANGVITHPHNNGPNVSPNAAHNNNFIKYNSSNTNLAGLVNNTNAKNLNGYSMPGNANGFNNGNGNNMTNGPLKMNNNMSNTLGKGMNYFGGMSKPLTLSPTFNKNPNGGLRKRSESTDLPTQLLNMNISHGVEKNDNDMMKSSLVQSKSENNISGLLNRKGSTTLINAIENVNSGNNGTSGSNSSSPFFKKNSIYDDMNGLKPSNSNQLLSAGNFGMDRNDFMAPRKLSNASSILMDNAQNSNVGLVNSIYDNNSNYTNNKFMMPSDVSYSGDYVKGGYNSMMPMPNYNNYPDTTSQQPPIPNKETNLTLGKVNLNDPMSKDMFNQMNYSNDPDTLFNSLNRTLSDSALNKNIFEEENDGGNTSINLNAQDKLHPSMALNNNNLHQNPPNSTTTAFNLPNVNNEKLPFMPMTMGGHNSLLSSGNRNDNMRNALKQNSLSSLELMNMSNLYNGPINTTTFSHPLMKTPKNEIPFMPNIRSNTTSPFIDLSNGNNLLSAGIANSSFSNMNGIPSILNKSKSFCAINSLNNDTNRNPNELSFTSIFSSDKKDSNNGLDGGISIMNNRYGVESPKSMYEPILKNIKGNDNDLEGNTEKSKSVGVIGENSTTKNAEKTPRDNNDIFENDYDIKVNNNNNSYFTKDISSSCSDSSINENDFIEFIATKRPESVSSDHKGVAKNELEVKELNNSTSKKSSISSITSPTIICSPTFNDKSDLSMDEVMNNNTNTISKVSSSSSSTTQINSKLKSMSYSTLVNNNGDSFETKKLSDDDIGKEEEKNKSNDDLIKQLYLKIEQLQKENQELTQTRENHLSLISKLENQLEICRLENSNLKEQLNRL